jgi:hypothetical protein
VDLPVGSVKDLAQRIAGLGELSHFATELDEPASLCFDKQPAEGLAHIIVKKPVIGTCLWCHLTWRFHSLAFVSSLSRTSFYFASMPSSHMLLSIPFIRLRFRCGPSLLPISYSPASRRSDCVIFPSFDSSNLTRLVIRFHSLAFVPSLSRMSFYFASMLSSHMLLSIPAVRLWFRCGPSNIFISPLFITYSMAYRYLLLFFAR